MFCHLRRGSSSLSLNLINLAYLLKLLHQKVYGKENNMKTWKSCKFWSKNSKIFNFLKKTESVLFRKKVLVWRQCIRFFRRMNFDLAEMVETGREKRINENKLGWVQNLYPSLFCPGKVVFRRCSILIS